MKSLAVSVCITAVTGMAAVSLLVFFWCSSVFFCVIEHQKNTRRTPEEHQKNTRRTQKEKNTSPPDSLPLQCPRKPRVFRVFSF